jgi:hypothetical protein
MKNHFEKKNQTLKKTLHGKTTLHREEENFHHTQYHQKLKKKKLKMLKEMRQQLRN